MYSKTKYSGLTIGFRFDTDHPVCKRSGASKIIFLVSPPTAGMDVSENGATIFVCDSTEEDATNVMMYTALYIDVKPPGFRDGKIYCYNTKHHHHFHGLSFTSIIMCALFRCAHLKTCPPDRPHATIDIRRTEGRPTMVWFS